MEIDKFEERVKEIYEELHGSVVLKGDKETFHSMQRYNEFLECWKRIDSYYKKHNEKIFERFLEIGSLRGLWGIAYFSYCEQMGIDGEFTSVTWMQDVGINQQLHKTFQFLEENNFSNKLIDKNTLDDDSLEIVTNHRKSFNIVFIDGGHSYDAVTNDIKKFYPLAEDIVMFHDILPRVSTKDIAVWEAIQDSDIELDEEIIIGGHRKNNKGIGLSYK